MIQKIENGAYVKNQNSGYARVDYIDELLQNAVVNICARRGAFYPDKNFGSKLYLLKPKKEAEALALARQALIDIDGVYVSKCAFDNDTICFDLILNDKERQVRIPYDKI